MSFRDLLISTLFHSTTSKPYHFYAEKYGYDPNEIIVMSGRGGPTTRPSSSITIVHSAMSTFSRSSLSPSPSTEQAAKAILSGRKCYRMSKDKNEVVWPQHLEAVLVKGAFPHPPTS